jgi:hypothetical protein
MRSMTITIATATIHAAAANRPAGYVEDVMATGVVDGDTITFTAEQYAALAFKYSGGRGASVIPSAGRGPGTELEKLLKRFGINATPECQCRSMARKMDAWGPKECSKPERVEEVLAVMAQEAKKRGLPFVPALGRLLIRRAISVAAQRKLAVNQQQN